LQASQESHGEEDALPAIFLSGKKPRSASALSIESKNCTKRVDAVFYRVSAPDKRGEEECVHQTHRTFLAL
jgi:hypothetical protein